MFKIAQETGIRLTPEQWSQKFYGDSAHKSDMQSIIDKLQSQQTLEKLMADFYEKLSLLSATNMADPHVIGLFLKLKGEFECIASINFEKRVMAVPPELTSKPQTGSSNSAKSITAADRDLSERMGQMMAPKSSSQESLDNEDEEDFFDDEHFEVNHEFLFDDDDDESEYDECDEGGSDSAGARRARKFKHSEQQAVITWPLVIDSLNRLVKILTVYFEYSSKLSAIVVTNSQLIMAAVASANSAASAAQQHNFVSNGSGNRSNSQHSSHQPLPPAHHTHNTRNGNVRPTAPNGFNKQPMSPHMHKGHGFKPSMPPMGSVNTMPFNLSSMGPGGMIPKSAHAGFNDNNYSTVAPHLNYLMAMSTLQQQMHQQAAYSNQSLVNNGFHYNVNGGSKMMYLDKFDMNHNNLAYGQQSFNEHPVFKYQVG
jgi:hypothetical protein